MTCIEVKRTPETKRALTTPGERQPSANNRARAPGFGYKVRRTVRRRNGTPGDGCAVRAHRTTDAKIGRTPNSLCAARTSGCPAGGSWTSLSTLSMGTSLLQKSSQPGAVPWASPSTAWSDTAEWGWTGVAPSQLHAFAIPANSANSHNPRTVEARIWRWRCSKRDISFSMLPRPFVLNRTRALHGGQAQLPVAPPPFTCPSA